MKTISEKLLEMFERDANQTYITLLNVQKHYTTAQENAERALMRYKELAEKMAVKLEGK